MEPICEVGTFKQLLNLILVIAFFAAIIGTITFFITRRQNAGMILDVNDWASEYLREGIYRFQIINYDLGLVALQRAEGGITRIWRFPDGIPSHLEIEKVPDGLVMYSSQTGQMYERWECPEKLVGA